jgi:hypothetical protein
VFEKLNPGFDRKLKIRASVEQTSREIPAVNIFTPTNSAFEVLHFLSGLDIVVDTYGNDDNNCSWKCEHARNKSNG